MKQFLLCIFVIIIAAFLRLYQLGSVPISPDWDETALGYNAYSILRTGRDEYGTKFPLSIRSFDDYKPPLYVYLTVPSVALFGLSTWSTRLPSAVMGIIAVIGTFFLVRELCRLGLGASTREKFFLPVLTSFLLAVSPWHIQFSRIAFEANIGVTMHIWAVVTFLVGLRKKIFLTLSATLFGLGIYAYHSERVFLPLLLILLIIIFRKTLFSSSYRKTVVQALFVGFIVALPLIPVFFSSTGMMRLRGTSSFSDQTNLLSRTIDKLQLEQKQGNAFGMLLDNRRLVWVKTVISGYLAHFSIKWLFLTGDNPRHHAPDMGLFYLWEFPFFLFGLFELFKVNRAKQVAFVVIGWLLIAPIPASVTTGLPHAVRTLVFLPTFQIIIALGMVRAISLIKGAIQYGVLLVGIVAILFGFTYYFDMYYVQMNPEYSEYWQYGYEQVVKYTEAHKRDYDQIVVSTDLEQSYMFFLFYTKFDPRSYLATGGTKSGNFLERNNGFDKYVFKKIDLKDACKTASILYVGTPSEIPHGNVMNYKFLNGKPSIELADCKGGAL